MHKKRSLYLLNITKMDGKYIIGCKRINNKLL